MKKITTLLLLVALTIGMFAGCAGGEESSGTELPAAFSVGYSKVDITPRDSVPLAGFGDNNERQSTGVLDPIYATCVAFSDTNGTTVLVYSTDLLNTPADVLKVSREKITEATGVPGTHIHFTASHTHSSYDQSTQGHPHVTAARELFYEQCVYAAKEAMADRKPAQMYGSFARPDNLNFVRHYVLSDGTYQAFKLGYLPRDQIYGHMWKADNLLQVIKFTREGGKDVVLVNWQSHYYGTSDVDYYGISADYPGALRNELEAQLDCHAAFVLGGGGNVNCTSQIKSENHNKGYAEHGKMLATAAIESMANMQPLETGTIQLKQLAFVAEGTIKENELTAFGFGDFGMVFSPWEIFDIHAKGVRDASKYTYTFYGSCADGGWGNRYLAHEAAFSYYCYETSTAAFPMGTAEAVEAALTNLINECFQASGQTQKERVEGYTSTPYVPTTDGVEYINPKPGDMNTFTLGLNGHYYTMFVGNMQPKALVIENEEVAKLMNEKASMKLLFDDRNIVVGIAE